MKLLKKILFFAWSPAAAPRPEAAAYGEGVAAGTPGPGDNPPPSEPPGTFVTPATLITFTGATAGIVALTAFLGLFVPQVRDGQGKTIATAIVALIIGLILFWVSVSEAASRPKNRANWALALIVALINIAYLTTASLGIPLAFSKAGESQSPPTEHSIPAPPQTSP